MSSTAGELDRRCALVLGITGPEPGLGEAELGAPAPLAYALVRAEELAGSLAAYGYENLLDELGRAQGGVAAAADVTGLLDAAIAQPGLVVVHLLTHGDPGPGRRCCMCWARMGSGCGRRWVSG